MLFLSFLCYIFIIMDEKRDLIIAQIKDIIPTILAYEQIYLFGSASKASWDGKGDWDLLIITRNKLSRCEKWAHAKTIRIELARLDIACDILIISRNEQIEAEKSLHSIARSAIHEGIKIA